MKRGTQQAASTSGQVPYTSELACQGLGLMALGEAGAAPAGQHCVLCGRPLLKHTPAMHWRGLQSKTFTDQLKLAAAGDWACGWCAATTSSQRIMRALQACVVTAGGVYSIAQRAKRLHFWLTPPTPPFAVVINNHAPHAFHYFWRTPVTLDAQMVWTMIDGTVYPIDRARILRAMQEAKLLRDVSPAPQRPVRGYELNPMLPPFERMPADSATAPYATGVRFRREAIEAAAHDAKATQALRFARTLSEGERQVLACALGSQVLTKPEPPALINLQSDEDTAQAPDEQAALPDAREA